MDGSCFVPPFSHVCIRGISIFIYSRRLFVAHGPYITAGARRSLNDRIKYSGPFTVDWNPAIHAFRPKIPVCCACVHAPYITTEARPNYNDRIKNRGPVLVGRSQNSTPSDRKSPNYCCLSYFCFVPSRARAPLPDIDVLSTRCMYVLNSVLSPAFSVTLVCLRALMYTMRFCDSLQCIWSCVRRTKPSVPLRDKLQIQWGVGSSSWRN